jgi:outer membrane receptor protein involved in Fe transport
MSVYRRLSHIPAGLLPGGLLLCAATPALAAAPPAVLEEVVVTATKRAESIQDVPLSVSAVTAADIQKLGASHYADLLNTVPGVYFQDSGPGVSQIRIRGISANESAVPSTTATYFGESITSVLTNGGGKPDLRLVDIDRLEVLRGPQGTLFGASALAGVVRTIPNAPDASAFSASAATRGFATAHSSDASYHVEGVVNLPLVQDRLALRLVGYKDDIAGYIDNVSPAQASTDFSAAVGAPDGTLVTPATPAFTRRDINSENTWGGRAALRWNATDRLRLDLSYAAQDVRLESQPNATPSIGEYETQRPLDQFAQGRYDERLNVGALVVNYDWDAASLVSATNWMRMKRFSDQDLGFLAGQAFGVELPWSFNEQSIGRLFTQEVRLQSSGKSNWGWLVGAFYLRQTADAGQLVTDFSCPTCLSEALAGEDFAYRLPLGRFSEEKQGSVFGEVSYSFTPRWTVGVGARYLHDKLIAQSPPQEGLLAGGGIPAQPSVSGTKSELNPSAYLRFKPNADTTWYLQAARGFRSGTVNQALPDACQAEAATTGLQQVSDPDTLWNYEAGIKARFAEGRYSVHAAAFYQKWDGVQLVQSLTCGFSGVLNGGKVKGHGAELEIVAQPTDAWRFNLAAAYNHNRFEDVAPGTSFQNDERVPDAPENNASLGAQYNFAVTASWSGFARADLVHVGNVITVVGVSDRVRQDAFELLNLRLGFERDAWAAELYGRNVTDERGVLTTNSNTSLGINQTLTRPREVGIELRYVFR